MRKGKLIEYFLRVYIYENILHKEIYDETLFEKLDKALNNIFIDVKLIQYEISDSQFSIFLSFKDEGEEKEIVVFYE